MRVRIARRNGRQSGAALRFCYEIMDAISSGNINASDVVLDLTWKASWSAEMWQRRTNLCANVQKMQMHLNIYTHLIALSCLYVMQINSAHCRFKEPSPVALKNHLSAQDIF
jgi:hypothetical protein